MQTIQLLTMAPVGLGCQPVTVEVAARPGLSSLTIVGLADRTVRESKERVRLALRSLGVTLPSTNIVVNLAPAELTKHGTHYDLPIALALLAASGVIRPESLAGVVVAGELGLDGSLRRWRQAVSVAIATHLMKHKLLTSQAVATEVGLVGGLPQATYRTLAEIVDDLKAEQVCFAPTHLPRVTDLTPGVSFEDILGLAVPKRAVVISAAGGHNLLLTGPPGVGKTLLAQSLAQLLPPLTRSEQLSTTSVYSAAGLLNDREPFVATRPFRQPHHSATLAAMIGGGHPISPGEISLAHHGVLFLDELPLFSKPVLAGLREPLESGRVVLTRAQAAATFPARSLVVGAYNPCPCGYAGDPLVACRCTPNALMSYRRALAGPLLSRFPLFAACGRSGLREGASHGISQAEAVRLVAVARQQQRARGQKYCNGVALAPHVRTWLEDASLTDALDEAITSQGISLRAAWHAVRVARTLADLDQEPLIGEDHLQEALGWLPPPML